MLTNIPNNYWENLIKYCDENIRREYNAQELFEVTTSDTFKEYRNLFAIEQILDK